MQQSSATQSLHLSFWGLRKIVACSHSSSQCLLVSTVFGTVSSLHPTSFLMIFTLVRCRDDTVPKTVDTRSHCKVWLRACNNLPQPPPYISVFWGCGRLLHALNHTLQWLLVSTVFGTVSFLHLISSRYMILHLYIYKCKNIKNEVGCRDDTVPKTVETRGHCEED